jgi:signal transduction histidine kinase
MRSRMWLFVALAFCALLSLVVASAWAILRKMRELDSETDKVHRTYQQADDALTEIRMSVYRTALITRALPDTSQANAIAARRSRYSADAGVRTLAAVLGSEYQTRVNELQRELDSYWNAAAAVVDEAQHGKALSIRAGHNKEIEHEDILELAEQLDALNEANIKRQEREIQNRFHELRTFLAQGAAAVLLLGLAIAAGSTFRLSRIERRAEEQASRAEHAEFELRRLSNQLVRAQEEERKVISRELHDEVGQLLTGLRMELGNLGQWSAPGKASFQERLSSVKGLAENALRSVRDIAMLLRPSMLDDLGLGAALRWQAKEFMRRTGVPVDVRIGENMDKIHDPYRTCLYRVVQEALTNCARHAQATEVTIGVHDYKDLVTASIQDNGTGFVQDGMRTRGLGLISMEERVRELQGRLAVQSELGHGTTVRVELPLPEKGETPATLIQKPGKIRLF